MHTNSQNILISLPKQLLSAIDIVKNERQISRSAFIRESLLRNIRYYEKYERGRVGCQLDDPEFNCGGHFENSGVPATRILGPSPACFEGGTFPFHKLKFRLAHSRTSQTTTRIGTGRNPLRLVGKRKNPIRDGVPLSVGNQIS
jgi:hypothetical protein